MSKFVCMPLLILFVELWKNIRAKFGGKVFENLRSLCQNSISSEYGTKSVLPSSAE